tara:strand:- start:10989 stop:12869 length:1881 start_codon:yes stop_codon:yes gene_type:complete
MSQIVFGTAGHIDHGKTTLVKALTGINTDNLREEQERGMTIDLGFAFLSKDITIIDVPGHEKFIRNMVAGVTSIDSALLTIAADDGIMPQTKEHFDILSILGVPSGIVVINKIDLVHDPEWLELMEEEIKELLAGSFMEKAPIIRVSSITGEGIELLRSTLLKSVVNSKVNIDRGFFRLFADRVFSMKGFGTVVTGTVTGGSIQVGEEIELLPSMGSAKIRGLQSHGKSVAKVGLGYRAAINLSQLDKAILKRGSQLSEKEFLKPSMIIGISFSMLEKTKRKIRHQQRVRFHIGTEEILGRIFFVEEGIAYCNGGGTEIALARLEKPVAVAVEDKFIIRFYSPAETIGGGIIIDPFPPERFKIARSWLKSLSQKTIQERLEMFFIQSGNTPLTLMGWRKRWQASSEKFFTDSNSLDIIKFGNPEDPFITLQSIVDEQLGRYIKKLSFSLKRLTARRGVPREDLRKSLGFSRPLFDWLSEKLVTSESIQIESGNISLTGYTVKLSSEDSAIAKKLSDILNRSGFTPPIINELASKVGANVQDIIPLLHFLKDKGEIKKISDKLWYHKKNIEILRKLLIKNFSQIGSFDIAQFKELTNTSRRHAIPLLEYFDNQRFTDRQGNRRIFCS